MSITIDTVVRKTNRAVWNQVKDGTKKADMSMQKCQKLFMAKISGFFIGSPDTGYQFVYLLYLICSSNASAIRRTENIFAALRKNGWQKPFWTRIKSTWKSC